MAEPSPLSQYRSTQSLDRVCTEDTLKYLHECEYEGERQLATAEGVAGVLNRSLNETVDLLKRMRQAGLVSLQGSAVGMTDEGRSYARQVIRAHRLYETYLARMTDERPARWHRKADEAEHHISAEDVDALSQQLGHPRYDPHGDPIPTRAGELPELTGGALEASPLGAIVRVLHVGDEPEALGHLLVELGLAPGMLLKVVERGNDQMRIWVEGRECTLDRAAAALVRVAEADCDELPRVARLSSLAEGEEAIVVRLLASCTGSERTRLLDLGFVPPSRVSVELKSPMGSPVAYRIRNTLVALRPEQADQIVIETPEPEARS
ncbi:metal-dependent transcriptional regulator [Ruficoccus amylovorans]|uniref:Metal-dependent transcriptional regulator n=1 Tax=Ruficoccus amylovorans TaxID=1804625 RepID=A0A842HH35_9BACT|nr:metal-dependent transcriptional regulator [Ruficoccus amylovorans]MBC2595308.1 metal-dependent transcriptional regulator [Ruficoccus amylovorans]